MIQPWKMWVTSPTGSSSRLVERDQSYIRSTGLRMQLTPEGDCREATFDAKGTGLGLRPLDCVQVAYGGVPLFYGEVRVGGNIRDVDGHRHVLRSLAQRLGDVTLSGEFTAPQQPAHLTVRALLLDVFESLRGTVHYDPALCPDLGFDLAPIKASNYQTPKALLDKIVEAGKSFGVTVVYGVGPDRRFFCRAAQTNMLALDPSQLTGATTWQPPVAEVVCTSVRWLLDRVPDQPGRWLTHVSRSAEAAIYGERVRTVAWANVEGQPDLWEVLPSFYAVDAGSTFNAYRDNPAATGQYDRDLVSHSDPNNAAERLVNGKMDDVALSVYRRHEYVYDGNKLVKTIYNSDPDDLVITASPKGPEGNHASGPFDRVTFALGGEWVRRVYSPDGWYAEESKPVQVQLTVGDWVEARQVSALYSQPDANGAMWRMGSGGMQTVIAPGTHIECRVNMQTKPGPEYELFIYVHELRAEQFNRVLLDRTAHHYYKTPAQEPADIELRTFLPPSALPKYVTLGDYQSIVDAWEYRLSADRGMTLGCLTGQAEDPAALAQADLIKARDGEAVITAITTGGI